MIMTDKKSLGLYIHIPFCKRKCLYCDFCSLGASDSELIEKYVSSLVASIEERAQSCRDYEVDTIYIGGGTPTVLGAEQLRKIVDACGRYYSVKNGAEISCECNPATVSGEYLRDMYGFGINRLSIGMQSTHDNELLALGRIHSYFDFVKCFEDARGAGFDNVSVDLMYGIPEQSVESFGESLRRICELSPEHISTYCLKVEKDTPFGRMGDALVLPSEDEQYEMYMLMSEYLPKRGYNKYEISNFSKSGSESKHNMRYWLGADYLGFGAAAHSFFRGERFSLLPNVALFAEGEWRESEREIIDDTGAKLEYVMLRMRLADGIELDDFAKRFGEDFLSAYPAVFRFEKSGHITLHDGKCRFTDKGFFVSSYILSEMLDF